MATVKPANFPVISTKAVKQTAHSQPVRRRAVDRTQQTQKPHLQPKENVAVRQAAGVKTSKDVKLEKAVEVLRAKTIQLYHPNQAKVKPTAPLGQFIDVKA